MLNNRNLTVLIIKLSLIHMFIYCCKQKICRKAHPNHLDVEKIHS